DMEALQKSDFNFKSKLLEWGQKEKVVVEFAIKGEHGDGFKKQYHIEVKLDGKTMSHAKDFSIKGAEQLAAEKTWATLLKEERVSVEE
ncbi:MAG: putative dsRNA-binding protein, partial [Ignavibacteria bacterium]|nr:putative dsRNA-binding protein [Ignavibacteria bacterium]